MTQQEIEGTEPQPQQQSVAEVLGTITGFEETLIERRFRTSWENLPGSRLARAMAMVQDIRSGMSEADAWKVCMESRLSELQVRFKKAEDPVLPPELAGDDEESGSEGK